MPEQSDRARSSTPLEVLAKVRRVDALFRAMSTDFLLEEQFVTDPAQILSEYVQGRPMDKEQGAALNKLIYAVVVETPLFGWLAQYATRQRGATMPSRETFIADFSDAVIAARASRVARMFMSLGLSEARSVQLNEDTIHPLLLTLARYVELGSRGRVGVQTFGQLTATATTTGTVTAGGPVFDGTEMSTGTEESTGTGTEVSTGTSSGTNTGTESSGTQISTGTGTGTGTGTDSGTEVSTGTSSGTESSGTQISTGTGTDTGTEMSTGTNTGTESSGTQMSTGTGTGTDDSGTEVSGTQISTGGGGTEMSTEGGTGGGTDGAPSGTNSIDWWDIIRHITLGTATVDGPPTIGGTHVPPGPPPWRLRELFGATYAAGTLEALYHYSSAVAEAGLLSVER